jgi:hypothetical protein
MQAKGEVDHLVVFHFYIKLVKVQKAVSEDL